MKKGKNIKFRTAKGKKYEVSTTNGKMLKLCPSLAVAKKYAKNYTKRTGKHAMIEKTIGHTYY